MIRLCVRGKGPRISSVYIDRFRKNSACSEFTAWFKPWKKPLHSSVKKETKRATVHPGLGRVPYHQSSSKLDILPCIELRRYVRSELADARPRRPKFFREGAHAGSSRDLPLSSRIQSSATDHLRFVLAVLSTQKKMERFSPRSINLIPTARI